MFEAVDAMAQEHGELEQQLGAPETHADARLAKKLNQRYAQLSRILAAKEELDTLTGDLEAARELAAEDASFAAEVDTLAERRRAPPRSGCGSCWSRGTPSTTRTRSSR